MKRYLILGALASIVLSCQNNVSTNESDVISATQDSNSSIERSSISIQDPIDSLSNLDSLQNLFTLSEDFLADLNRNKGNFIDGSPYIKKEDAKGRIAVYKAHETILRAKLGELYDPKKDIYGFTFKLEHLDDFLKKIKEHNIDHVGDSAKVIVGVRAYKSWRIIDGKLAPEIFLMPTIASRGNLYRNVDSDLSVGKKDLKDGLNSLFLFDSLKNGDDPGDLILDTSIPCPNNCN